MNAKQLWALMDRLPSFNSAWTVAQNIAWQTWQDAANVGASDTRALYVAFVATFT